MGGATPSSGRRARRRRPTTSTTCRRSAPSARSSTSATAGRPRTERTTTMTSDASALTHDGRLDAGAQPRRRARPRHPRRDQQPDPRDAPVHLLGGDVLLGLFAAYFSVRANADQWPPDRPRDRVERSTSMPSRGRCRPDDHPDHLLVHLPVRRLGDPARRPDRRSCATRGHAGPRRSSSCVGQVYDYATLGFGGVTLTRDVRDDLLHADRLPRRPRLRRRDHAVAWSCTAASPASSSSKHHDAVEAASLYWHFVDVVWIAAVLDALHPAGKAH